MTLEEIAKEALFGVGVVSLAVGITVGVNSYKFYKEQKKDLTEDGTPPKYYVLVRPGKEIGLKFEEDSIYVAAERNEIYNRAKMLAAKHVGCEVKVF